MTKSKIILKWNVFLLSISSSQQAAGDTNMKDASFFRTWVDHVIKRDRRDLKINRTYKSRSLYHGIFGFGWCSDLDLHLNIIDSHNIELIDCNTTRPIRYIKKHNESQYISETKPSDHLHFDGHTYLRKENGLSTQRFNRDGTLEPNKLIFNDIAKNESGHIKNISLADGTKLHYIYNEKNLVQIKKNGQLLFSYKYDDLHNLTKVQYPDSSYEQISYDSDRDWVRSFTGRSGCTEHYNFITPNPGNKNYFMSTINKKCAGSKELRTKYEFWHATNSNGQTYLAQIKISSNFSQTAQFENALKGDSKYVQISELQKSD